MIFVNICSTWSNLLFLFNNTYGLPVLTIDTESANQVFYVSLVDIENICVK
jgi:hypothetical protein